METTMIPLGRLLTPAYVWRVPSPSQVADIVKSMDQEKVGTFLVNFRDDRYYVIDGHTRGHALKQHIGTGWEGYEVPCEVVTLGEKEEAACYLEVHTSKPPTRAQILEFRQQVKAIKEEE